jgi:hypothetical protein
MARLCPTIGAFSDRCSSGVGLQNPNLFKIDHLLRNKSLRGWGRMCLRREKGASRPAAAICSARSDFSAKPVITFFGWAGTALMAVTVVALLWSSFG